MLSPSFDQALGLEWLCTNGLGGFASSTVAGVLTRRYHGLLIAALQPPLGRTLLLAKLDETLWLGGLPFELATNEYEDGTVHPAGHHYLADFRQDGSAVVWQYAFQGWRLVKRVWMEPGQNTTFVSYTLSGAESACRLQLLPLCASRDFHSQQHGPQAHVSEMDAGALRVQAHGGPPMWIACDQPMGFEPHPDTYYNFLRREERARGLDATEDLFSPGVLAAALLPDKPVVFRVSTQADAAPFVGAADRLVVARQAAAPDVASAAGAAGRIEQRLRSAASQFVVAGAASAESRVSTVIAGYHWFGDWGRDTMIALPGLTLVTGRFDVARSILSTFLQHVDAGLIPNAFGESGGAEYNNVDGTLWLFYALDRYVRAAEDGGFLREVFPTLEAIVQHHLQGTRHHIAVDPVDGLLSAGEEGLQLTWMDAKVDGWVVTPRIGKPVEVNALWFNALCLMAAWARELGQDGSLYQRLATQAGASFRQRFWNAERGCLFDVIDGPTGDDPSLRPNQILAVSLPFAPVYGGQARAVVDTVERVLLTPYGLRTLDPADPRYVGQCSGGRWQRDGAYHQGTVWPWLLGPFVDAHRRVSNDATRAIALLKPLIEHLDSAGLGTISEIFDGDEPHVPRGCIAQAWSVAEVLRCWHELHAPSPKPPPLLGGNGHARH